MSWDACCKKHLKSMVDHLEKKNYKVGWSDDDIDKRMKCGYPGCKEKVSHEVYYYSQKEFNDNRTSKPFKEVR